MAVAEVEAHTSTIELLHYIDVHCWPGEVDVEAMLNVRAAISQLDGSSGSCVEGRVGLHDKVVVYQVS